MQDRIFEMLFKEEEITWKDILYDLVKKEGLNPWDVDISDLTKKYLIRVQELKVANLKLSGKVLLAAAFLLRMKATRLVEEDMDALDAMIAQKDLNESEFYDELEAHMRNPGEINEEDRAKLIPRTPLPRERKVTIQDLVKALEQALEVKKRRLIKKIPNIGLIIPFRKYDITLNIKRMYIAILDFCNVNKGKVLLFSIFAPSSVSKEEKVQSFLPLLHLSNEHKIEMEQDVPFGEIRIRVIDPKKIKVATQN